MKWYLKVLRQYADFSGRARRKEYWMFVLFNCIFAGLVTGIDTVLMINGIARFPVCSLTYPMAMIMPSLAVVVRRLHDTGRSGWWVLITLIPLIGGIWLLVLILEDSQRGDNRYGANPKILPQRRSEKAWLLSATVMAIIEAVDIMSFFILYFLYQINRDISLTDPMLVRLVLFLLLLLLGILLFPRRSSGSLIEKARRRVSLLLIIYAGVMILRRGMWIIIDLFQADFSYSPYFLIINSIYLLCDIAILFFSVTLAQSNRKLRKTASIVLMIIAGVVIGLSIYVDYNQLTLIGIDFVLVRVFNALSCLLTFPIFLMILADTFMPRKTEQAEENGNL
jgi:uncharacterized membrane protein YhaH (DUF805 family)/phage shock protein PspC (stress-responsive transcriptional regulator)